MLSELATGHRIVGVKQIRKALQEATARKVFIAENADPHLTEPLAELCSTAGVPVEFVPTMAEIGAICGIDVGAAAAAIVR